MGRAGGLLRSFETTALAIERACRSKKTMPMASQAYERHLADVAVIGGGLTGILAALRLARAGARVVLVDRPLPQANARIGGFARFSGAKFSLPPAGMGLAPVAGSESRLSETIHEVLHVLRLNPGDALSSTDGVSPANSGLTLRQYDSIVLTPAEIEQLLDRLTSQLASSAELVRGTATRLIRNGADWQVDVQPSDARANEFQVVAKAVFFAAGRLSDDILLAAGAIPNEGKGLDIGVRLEFLQRDALSGLRRHGPDAKFMWETCRTFCLNSPGIIYRYPFQSIMLPGGVVAGEDTPAANVGLLLRVPDKQVRLSRIMENAAPLASELIAESDLIRVGELQPLPRSVGALFGEDAANQLSEFCHLLHAHQLLDLNREHRVHLPLLDWHWNTYAQAASHRTSLDRVYALGDSSGHARGLLQAAVSGWLAAEEYLC